MKTLISLSLISLLSLMTACSGGSGNNNPTTQTPSAKTAYGKFRNLKSSTATFVAGTAAANFSTPLMQVERAYHKCITMTNGKILLVGGLGDAAGYSMDIFDPATETFTASSARMSIPRAHRYGSTVGTYRTMALCNLPDGKVLILGGGSSNDINTYYSDIYDPVTDTVNTIYLSVQIYGISEAKYIGNNTVLLYSNLTQPFLIYLDQIDSQGYVTMKALPGHSTTSIICESSILLSNGTYISFGGYGINTPGVSTGIINQFNPETDLWNYPPELQLKKHLASAVLLPNNKVAIYGGYTNNQMTKSVEVYDPATGTSVISTDLISPKANGDAVLLQSGYVLYSGGMDIGNTTSSTELVHNPITGDSTITGNMNHPRLGHAIVQLPNGLVLVSGGAGDRSSEIFDPQSKIYLRYPTDSVLAGETLSFSTDYAAGVTWIILPGGLFDKVTIDADGMLHTTVDTTGIVEVQATAKDNSNLTAVVKITVVKS